MAKFHVGDHVILVSTANVDHGTTVTAGDEGTVVMAGGIAVGVEFTRDINGHDCGGIGAWGHCWGVPTSSISLLREPTCSEEELADLFAEVFR